MVEETKTQKILKLRGEYPTASSAWIALRVGVRSAYVRAVMKRFGLNMPTKAEIIVTDGASPELLRTRAKVLRGRAARNINMAETCERLARKLEGK